MTIEEQEEDREYVNGTTFMFCIVILMFILTLLFVIILPIKLILENNYESNYHYYEDTCDLDRYSISEYIKSSECKKRVDEYSQNRFVGTTLRTNLYEICMKTGKIYSTDYIAS